MKNIDRVNNASRDYYVAKSEELRNAYIAEGIKQVAEDIKQVFAKVKAFREELMSMRTGDRYFC